MAVGCRQTNMSSYLTVTSSGLFLLKYFEERGVQKFAFQIQMAGKGDYAKLFHGKY